MAAFSLAIHLTLTTGATSALTTGALILRPSGAAASPTFCIRCAIAHAHRQPDALARDIHAHHLDLHDIACLDHIAWVLDKGVGQGRDVYQSILVHTHINKGTKRCHVGHLTFEHLIIDQVAYLLYTIGKPHGLELGAWVTSGLLQFCKDVPHGGLPKTLICKVRRVLCV